MALFKIIDIFVHDDQLVVKVEHYNPDSTVWFVEHYTWQGREGLKQKRATNALGQPLLNNGAVAPSTIALDGRVIYSLPLGRDWLRLPGTHLTAEAILGVIRSIHQQRLATGWAIKLARLPAFKAIPEDTLGVAALRLQFQGLIGRQE